MNVSKGKLTAVGIGAFLMMLCAGIINNSTTYFMLSVTEYLNVTKTTFSIYFTIVTVCSAIMALVVMPIATKLGPTKSALTAMIGGGCGFFLLSRLTALWMVYAGAVLVGVFQSFVVVPSMSIINKWFVGKNTSTVTGIVMSATGFGGLMMGVLMPSVVSNFSWRTGYLVCTALWVVVTLLISILTAGEPPKAETVSPVPETAQDSGAGEGAAKKGSAEYLRLIRSPRFILLMITAMASAGVTMISQHMSVLLETNGMGVTMISAIMGVMSIALAIAKIIEGSLYDRVPRKIFTPVVMLIGAVGYFCLSLHSTSALILGVVGYGISAASCTVLYPAIMRHMFGRKMTTATWGICWAMFMLGHAVWTPLYAWTFDMTGSYSLGVYITTAIYIFLAVYLFILLSRPAHEED